MHKTTPALNGCGGGPLAVASLTWCGCRGRRSTTLLQPSVLLWAKWSGTSWECACQCGTPCGCTGPSRPGHLCRAYSLRSPPRYLHHSSLLCSFSAGRRMTFSVYPGDTFTAEQKAGTRCLWQTLQESEKSDTVGYSNQQTKRQHNLCTNMKGFLEAFSACHSNQGAQNLLVMPHLTHICI